MSKNAKRRRGSAANTVHAYVEGLLARTTKPYAEIAQEARKVFDSETSAASVRHYASKMRKAGKPIKDRPVSREAAYA